MEDLPVKKYQMEEHIVTEVSIFITTCLAQMTMEPAVEQPKGMESVVRKDILAKRAKANFPYLNGPTDKIMEFRRM